MEKLVRLNADLQKEITSLLSFFGEKDGAVESLFSTVLTFAHGLQKAAAEMTRHAIRDEEAKKKQDQVVSEGVSRGTIDAMSRKLDRHEAMLAAVTVKKPKRPSAAALGGAAGSYFPQTGLSVPELLTPEPVQPGLGGDATLARKKSVRGTLSRGELDEAIRSIHGGVKRRERDTLGRGGVRLSRMFLDGGQSRSVGTAAGKIEGMGGGAGLGAMGGGSVRLKEGLFKR